MQLTHLDDVTSALQSATNARKENKNKAAEMLTKVKILYEHARVRVLGL